MRRNEFSEKATGSLVNIPSGVAFLPNPLPPLLPATQTLLLALDEARGSLGMLASRSENAASEILIQRPLFTREALKSTRIEGTFAEASDVLRQDVAGAPRSEARTLDNLEVIRYSQALHEGHRWIEDGRDLSPFLARGLHATLLEGTRGADQAPGEYRDIQVFIGSEGDDANSARFVPPPPEHVAGLMDNIFEYFNSETGWPGLIEAAIIHCQFETIHPFRDGNGRLGRLMIPLTVMARGLLSRPNLYLSDYLDQHRDEYFDRMKAVSCDGDWEGWIIFFLSGVDATARDIVSRIRRINTLNDKYRALVRENSRSQAPLAAVELVMDRVFVRVADVASYARCSPPTARAALGTLTRLGIVEPVGDAYPPLWVATELLAEAYDD